jgi:outer membrane protein
MFADRRLIIGLATLLAAGTALVGPAWAQSPDPAQSQSTQGTHKKTADADKPPAAAKKPKKQTAEKGAAGKPADATFAATISTQTMAPSNATAALPRTLAGALAATYSTQPALQAERAKLRATDESVPQALAGWRPTVIVSGTAGYGDGYASQGGIKQRSDRVLATPQATLTQPLYTGGKVAATLHKAETQIMAERANLIAQEEQSFIDTVNA